MGIERERKIKVEFAGIRTFILTYPHEEALLSESQDISLVFPAALLRPDYPYTGKLHCNNMG